MALPPTVEAAALFGSAARGDSDHLSDHDLLLVGRSRSGLLSAASALRVSGWSCSIYTWPALEAAASRSSLFLNHLRLESRVVFDPCDRLRHLLSSISPRASYQWEIEHARELLGTLEWIPEARWGPTWALDVLAIAFRSLAIAELAQQGVFVFSLPAIVDRLIAVGILRSRDRRPLCRLRLWKAAYRKQKMVASSRTALDLLEIIDRRFRIGLHARFLLPELFVERTLSDVSGDRHWYRATRRAEACLRLTQSEDVRWLLQKLEQPQFFGRSALGDFIAYGQPVLNASIQEVS